MNTKDVALVLSSGGPRGFAYIGAIEELLSRGYRITSVAGCSVGSLVGGIWAAGGLADFKEWLFGLDNFKLMTLLDFTPGKSYLMKGQRVIRAIEEIVPDIEISSLPVSYTAVASDLYTGEEVIFREGPLFEAIRASISIPSLFKPVKYRGRTLIDGGLVNTFPLGLASRSGNDILVGFDVNAIDPADTDSFREKMEADGSYYSIINRSFSLSNHALAEAAIKAYRPDVLARLSLDSYGSITDYAKGREIAEKGRELMSTALDEYEAG